jgi:hypothetical protein
MRLMREKASEKENLMRRYHPPIPMLIAAVMQQAMLPERNAERRVEPLMPFVAIIRANARMTRMALRNHTVILREARRPKDLGNCREILRFARLRSE